jgi:hypothetical protein
VKETISKDEEKVDENDFEFGEDEFEKLISQLKEEMRDHKENNHIKQLSKKAVIDELDSQLSEEISSVLVGKNHGLSEVASSIPNLSLVSAKAIDENVSKKCNHAIVLDMFSHGVIDAVGVEFFSNVLDSKLVRFVDGKGPVISFESMNLDSVVDSGSPKYFDAIDQYFRLKLSALGYVERERKKEKFSSRSLYLSLVMTAIPPAQALKLIVKIIPLLEDKKSSLREDAVLTTTMIRHAVVSALDPMQQGNSKMSKISAQWSSSYIKRYGDPHKQCMYIEKGKVREELTYKFIESHLLPDLICEMFGATGSNPLHSYHRIFSSNIVSQLCRDIYWRCNSLNLYSARYSTLLNLFIDVYLEPPHPTFVNEATMEYVVDYNKERFFAHLSHLDSAISPKSQVDQYIHSMTECFQHLCAAILSNYGAYLGLGRKYGLIELRRVLHLLEKAEMLEGGCLSVWEFCTLHRLKGDIELLTPLNVGQVVTLLGSAWSALNRKPNNIDLNELRGKLDQLILVFNSLPNHTYENVEKNLGDMHILEEEPRLHMYKS